MFPKLSKTEQVKNYLAEHFYSLKFIYSTIRITSIRLAKEDFNEAYYNAISKTWFDENWENYASKMTLLNENLKKENKKLIIVIFPFTDQFNNFKKYGFEPQKKIAQFAEENNIPTLDLAPYLDTEGYLDNYLPVDHVHLNEKGYKFVVNIIYEKLMKEEMKNVKQ